jgi:predicted SPOUT superfamily RNA methylase MTH1
MNDKEKRVELPRWNDNGTFQKDGDTFYNWISEQRIREIIREEIVLYNETFMTAFNEEESVTKN